MTPSVVTIFRFRLARAAALLAVVACGDSTAAAGSPLQSGQLLPSRRSQAMNRSPAAARAGCAPPIRSVAALTPLPGDDIVNLPLLVGAQPTMRRKAGPAEDTDSRLHRGWRASRRRSCRSLYGRTRSPSPAADWQSPRTTRTASGPAIWRPHGQCDARPVSAPLAPAARPDRPAAGRPETPVPAQRNRTDCGRVARTA